ncbi:hypothetical protein PTNB73_04858 [Pyrenophora teres f. teres]|uniref:Major facilitator superfamily (MFS) profile domain-containing protein n=2 Tax=Pyrenophora teres f. teres TaxID=97479 RepID=E3S5U1_PYRTT|nr:hypothetical protein PTT_18045 [Pyrenophora teres f. teres 0-1]KAE8833761.1 hypothetical protein HRS9139_05580 [Pyrenophora teres f. teres]KAE8840468.1 hypothetical protein PTNB85_03867 [Pyrenophora teres f. teres]KAE8849392.1 hypothetical protein HRS9122_03408 [Pyrenophora teres f. teres]KAE8863967.1 hypothetical protein PTNB29_03931 [Pyrenophora teres f. teres]
MAKADATMPADDKRLQEDADTPSPSMVSATEAPVLTTMECVLTIGSIGLVVLMGALDSTIVATINPTLVAVFKSGKDIGWYGAVFLLVVGATLPFFGKLITIFLPRNVFLASLTILEIGCLMCALAQNSPTFIVGRAIAGLGCAGVLSGGLTITALITPLRYRAMFISIIGGLEGVSSIIGPVIGGVLTNTIGWRWGFWINLPCGGLLFGVLLLAFRKPIRTPGNETNATKSPLEKLRQLDFAGGCIIIGSLTCLLLALQWGGATYPWASGRIIALFVIFFISFVFFAIWETRLGDAALFPMRLLKRKAFVASLWFGFCISSGMWIILYYLPVWFQAIMGVTAEGSGVSVLPMVISEVSVATVAAALVPVVGYLPPFVFSATTLSSIGSGLLSSLHPGSSRAQWIGYQVILGAGYGIGIQQSLVNAQASVEAADVGYGTSAVLLGNILGGSIFISIAQAVFLGEVLKLEGQFPGVSRDTLINDFRSLREFVSPLDLATALDVYNSGLRKVFLMAAALCTLSVLAWPFIPWRSLKTKEKKDQKEEGMTETVGREVKNEKDVSSRD